MNKERTRLLKEAEKIGRALAETLAPLCEVVVHDLADPDHSVVFIGNNLSGREVGTPATELGLARIADPDFPDVLANYANRFPDGRPAKSTSIGLRDSSGRYVAAICLNLDVSYLQCVSAYIDALTRVTPQAGAVRETLVRREPVETKILDFSAKRNRDPRALDPGEKRTLIRALAADGELEVRGAAERIGAMLGLSRSNVYYYLKGADETVATTDLAAKLKERRTDVHEW
jgi:predicted transcriptional regulator YheO